jgi:hypothetical protein
VLVINVNSSIFVSKELRTQHGWCSCLLYATPSRYPTPTLEKKSSDLDELQGTAILLWGLKPPPAPFSCATANLNICEVLSQW